MPTFSLGPPIPQPVPLDELSAREIDELRREAKEHDQERRANARRNARQSLVNAGVKFDWNNGGAHLVVYVPDGQVVDFWPGTSLWIIRGEEIRHQGGAREIIAMCKVRPADPPALPPRDSML
jgi:hypothetical protein